MIFIDLDNFQNIFNHLKNICCHFDFKMNWFIYYYHLHRFIISIRFRNLNYRFMNYHFIIVCFQSYYWIRFLSGDFKTNFPLNLSFTINPLYPPPLLQFTEAYLDFPKFKILTTLSMISLLFRREAYLYWYYSYD